MEKDEADDDAILQTPLKLKKAFDKAEREDDEDDNIADTSS